MIKCNFSWIYNLRSKDLIYMYSQIGLLLSEKVEFELSTAYT